MNSYLPIQPSRTNDHLLAEALVARFKKERQTILPSAESLITELTGGTN